MGYLMITKEQMGLKYMSDLHHLYMALKNHPMFVFTENCYSLREKSCKTDGVGSEQKYGGNNISYR